MELPHESMPSQVVSGRATQKNGKVLGLSPETAGAEQLAVSRLESLVFFFVSYSCGNEQVVTLAL